ncbi:zinc ribbon domain-containing protein [Candidatus Contubernalis alkaliaceticus]|uniref:zinc ribbon domain-containing protein n=1 Tax=Candidatus Contubernalis alkaliaceticus TaxID=338645 RepID=UPI001F4C19DE|nr:zinc ribbon domain-containing protein [Candidatus Contubernalis alkalaceticus]UNC91115.1 hypothetical protein HUE98_02845 [Candidatus Contubernalis alkalaceticus]
MVSQNNQFCSSCDSKLEPGDKFCAGCGISCQDDPTKEGPVHTAAQTKSNKTKPVFILIAALIIIPLVFLAARTAVTTGTQKAIEDKLALAEKYLFDEEYDQAILAYREVIDIVPKEERAYTGLAKVYTVQDDYESAEEVLIEGIQIVEQTIPLRRNLADIYVIQGKYEEAKAHYLVILEEDENEQLAYQGLALVDKYLNELEESAGQLISNDFNRYVNHRFGFTVLFPNTWVVSSSPENNDGRSFQHPREDINIAVWGSHGMSALEMGFEEYMKWSFEILEELEGYELISDVEISKDLIVDYMKDGMQVKKPITLKGRRFEYKYLSEGKEVMVMEGITYFDSILYEIRCMASQKHYDSYHDLFLHVIYSIELIPQGEEIAHIFQ